MRVRKGKILFLSIFQKYKNVVIIGNCWMRNNNSKGEKLLVLILMIVSCCYLIFIISVSILLVFDVNKKIFVMSYTVKKFPIDF